VPPLASTYRLPFGGLPTLFPRWWKPALPPPQKSFHPRDRLNPIRRLEFWRPWRLSTTIDSSAGHRKCPTPRRYVYYHIYGHFLQFLHSLPLGSSLMLPPLAFGPASLSLLTNEGRPRQRRRKITLARLAPCLVSLGQSTRRMMIRGH